MPLRTRNTWWGVVLDARLDVDPRRAAVYRAAYAVVTATCFSPTGEDGHFAWCVAMLRRADVQAALR